MDRHFSPAKEARMARKSTTRKRRVPERSVSRRKRPAGTAHKNGRTQTIGGYLIQRLQDYGVRDVFGIPGDFVLHFYGLLEESPIRVVGTTREDCAGYAAD